MAVAAPSSRLREVTGEVKAVIAVRSNLMVALIVEDLERETGLESAAYRLPLYNPVLSN